MTMPNLAVMSKASVSKRIAANTGLMVGSKGVSALLGLWTILIAIKTLDPASVGIIVFLHAYQLFFAHVGTFQAWQTIIRFGTDDVKDNNPERLAKLLQFGYKLDIISAVVAFIAALGCFSLVVFVAESFPDVFPQSGETNIRDVQGLLFLYCTLILLRHRGSSIGVFRLFDRFDILAWHGMIQAVVRFVGVVIAAWTGAGMEGFLWAWFAGSLADYLSLPLLAGFQLRKRRLLIPVLTAKSSIRNPRPGVWPFVWKAYFDSTLAASNVHLPTLLVMAVFGSSWTAVYRVAEEIAKLLSEGFKLLDQVIYPELAKMVSMGEAAKIWRLVTRTAIVLLGFGLVVSLVLWFFLGGLITSFIKPEYAEAGPLASLLVPAAALLGVAAPLYPVLYATDHPERAIYARGAGVAVFIISFFMLSFTIGHMAPGWAAIAGNLTAVGLLLFLAKQALDRTVGRADTTTGTSTTTLPGFALQGRSSQRIWGLPLGEWQTRAFKKAGAETSEYLQAEASGIRVGVDYILSAELSKTFAKCRRTALIANGRVAALTDATAADAAAYIDTPQASLAGSDFIIAGPDDIDDGYNKALRKQEAPYVLDVRETPVLDIMRRQFKSSYKGITDFVTKWFWPVPAFYVTRLCAWLKLSPNQVTTIGFFLMLAATYFFWTGQWALGFACGWTMTFLDTVDGKLARTTMTYSKWGNIYDHGIDLIHPPFWYWAWFIGLGGAYTSADPMWIALLAIWVGYLVDRIIEGIFMRQHGFHIHVWTKFNSALRFFIARRNPNTFIMMIGIILATVWSGAGVWAFLFIAVWTWVCILANFVTLIAGWPAWMRKQTLTSWMDA